jgi:hypothetical protein
LDLLGLKPNVVSHLDVGDTPFRDQAANKALGDTAGDLVNVEESVVALNARPVPRGVVPVMGVMIRARSTQRHKKVPLNREKTE